jgi:hypothetical protein
MAPSADVERGEFDLQVIVGVLLGGACALLAIWLGRRMALEGARRVVDEALERQRALTHNASLGPFRATLVAGLRERINARLRLSHDVESGTREREPFQRDRLAGEALQKLVEVDFRRDLSRWELTDKNGLGRAVARLIQVDAQSEVQVRSQYDSTGCTPIAAAAEIKIANSLTDAVRDVYQHIPAVEGAAHNET